MANKNVKTWESQNGQGHECKPEHAKTSIDRLRDNKEIMDFLGVDEKTFCKQAKELETQL